MIYQIIKFISGSGKAMLPAFCKSANNPAIVIITASRSFFFNYVFLFTIILYLFAGGDVNAQIWSPPGINSRPPAQFFTYDFGARKIKEDYFLYLAPSFNFDLFSQVGVSLTVPLNILIQDSDPQYANSKRGMLRPEDYNEKSDYTRVINYIWYGTFGEYIPGKQTYSFRVGKIFDGYIGHGSIVRRYVNNQNLENNKLGIMADYNSDFFGAQVFGNSIYDREVNAGRIYIRPFAIAFKAIDMERATRLSLLDVKGKVIDDAGRKKVLDELSGESQNRYIEIVEDPQTHEKKEVMKEMPEKQDQDMKKLKDPLFTSDSWFNRFSIGYTRAFDSMAPSKLKLDSTGGVTYNKKGTLDVTSTERFTIEGYDAEYKVFSNKYFELTPYYDFNRYLDLNNSKGYHSGVFTRVGGKKIKVSYQPEYRRMTANYVPSYFDSYYEIERYQYNLNSTVPVSKLSYMKNLDPKGAMKTGTFQSLIIDFYNYVIQGEYEDYSGPDNSRVFLGFYIPVGKMFLISGYYNKKNFEKQKEAFIVDDRSSGAVEVGVKVMGIIVKLQNYRTWQFDDKQNKYVGVDDKRILFSGSAAF